MNSETASKLSDNVLNLNLRQALPMPVLFLVPLAAFFLEDDHFVILQMFDNRRFDLGVFYRRCANCNLSVIVNQQDFVEAYAGAFRVSETVNIQLTTFFNFELLPCNFYDSVHIRLLFGVFEPQR